MILVTGATGNVGSELTRALVACPALSIIGRTLTTTFSVTVMTRG
jgi:uncharacterized protein YbjT (DUF2867 family)